MSPDSDELVHIEIAVAADATDVGGATVALDIAARSRLHRVTWRTHHCPERRTR